jgi:hypothetical protein
MKSSRTCRAAGIAGLVLAMLAPPAIAAPWRGIEPLKSRRADVLRILGKPASENAAEASLRFATPEGAATVYLVTRDFAALKGWAPTYEGTVVQIIVQHENAKDTPKSLGLEGNRRIDREVRGDSVFYRDRKAGLIRIFQAGKLVTSIFAPEDGGPGPDD